MKTKIFISGFFYLILSGANWRIQMKYMMSVLWYEFRRSIIFPFIKEGRRKWG